MQHILTLCLGNICRSPLAEALLAREFPERRVWSAGLGAVVGAPADEHSIAIAAANGLDLSAHRAQQVTSLMCQRADLILVMEAAQRQALEKRYPFVRGKVFRVGEFQQLDVADPFRLQRTHFERAWTDISLGVTAWADRIRQLG